MPSLVVSYSHSDADIDRTLDALDSALAVYKQALDGGVERFLIGRPIGACHARLQRPASGPMSSAAVNAPARRGSGPPPRRPRRCGSAFSGCSAAAISATTAHLRP